MEYRSIPHHNSELAYFKLSPFSILTVSFLALFRLISQEYNLFSGEATGELLFGLPYPEFALNGRIEFKCAFRYKLLQNEIALVTDSIDPLCLLPYRRGSE